jgi:hypothetical protein
MARADLLCDRDAPDLPTRRIRFLSVDTKNDDGTFSAYRLIVLKSLNYDLMYSSLKCRPNF